MWFLWWPPPGRSSKTDRRLRWLPCKNVIVAVLAYCSLTESQNFRCIGRTFLLFLLWFWLVNTFTTAMVLDCCFCKALTKSFLIRLVELCQYLSGSASYRFLTMWKMYYVRWSGVPGKGWKCCLNMNPTCLADTQTWSVPTALQVKLLLTFNWKCCQVFLPHWLWGPVLATTFQHEVAMLIETPFGCVPPIRIVLV